MRYDVLIVGAGFAGLSAAAMLGKDGIKVALADKDRQVGGRAKVIEKRGFVFEYGVHSYRGGSRGAAARVLEEIGQGVDWIEDRATNYLVRGKEFLSLPGGPAEADSGNAALLEGEDLKRAVEIIGRLAGAAPEDWYGKSFADFLGDAASDETLLPLWKALGFTLITPDPARLSAGELISYLKTSFSAGVQSGEPRGGTREILKRLAETVKSCNGRMLLRTRVQELKIDRNRIWEAVTSRGNVHADAVIYAAPMQQLFGVMDKKYFKPDFISLCDKLKPTAGVSIDFALNRKISEVKGWILDVDENIMGRFPSNTDPSIAPEGRQISSWLMLSDPDDMRNRKTAQAGIRQLKARIRRLFPKFFDSVDFERILVLPMIDGVELSVDQCRPSRPQVACPGIDNLFFIGDCVSAEGVSGDIAWNSAREAVGLVKKVLGRG